MTADVITRRPPKRLPSALVVALGAICMVAGLGAVALHGHAAPDKTSYVATTGGWQTAGASLGLDSGFRWTLPCDEATADLVAACDGQRPLWAIAANH